MHPGMIGLGRTGADRVEPLMKAGHSVLAYDLQADGVKARAAKDARGLGIRRAGGSLVGDPVGMTQGGEAGSPAPAVRRLRGVAPIGADGPRRNLEPA